MIKAGAETIIRNLVASSPPFDVKICCNVILKRLSGEPQPANYTPMQVPQSAPGPRGTPMTSPNKPPRSPQQPHSMPQNPNSTPPRHYYNGAANGYTNGTIGYK